MLKLDREKYFQILQTEGLSAAVTTLHRDQSLFEFETFEGRDGYQREKWEFQKEFHELSRELWDRAAEAI
jgi:hypothetical protein